jgi:TDG/mug DNA glycosylase family protein
MGFTNAELEAYYGGSLPDLVGPGIRLLLVGINPGLLTAAVQAHFARRGNRFYPALYRAGILDRVVDASAGFAPEDRAHILDRGVGITSLVPSATRRADVLSPDDLRAGAESLALRVAEYAPAVVAMLGVTAYRVAFNRKDAVVGRQPEPIAGAELWVLPNPSGLNAHASLADLAGAYREVAVAAGIPVFDPPSV